MAIQDKFNRANVIYKITKDIDLGGETLTIPEGCTLDFQGGSFSNGSIVGNNTAIKATLTKIFGLDVELIGSWNIAEAYPEWFDAKGDGIIDDAKSINLCISTFSDKDTIIYLTGKYAVTNINVSKNCNIQGTLSASLLHIGDGICMNVAPPDNITSWHQFIRTKICNLKIQLNSKSKIGLRINQCVGSIFEKIFITGSNLSVPTLEDSEHPETFTSPSSIGVFIDGTSNVEPNNNSVFNNIFHRIVSNKVDIGFDFNGIISDSKFYNIESNTVGYGVRINSKSSYNLTFEDCQFVDTNIGFCFNDCLVSSFVKGCNIEMYRYYGIYKQEYPNNSILNIVSNGLTTKHNTKKADIFIKSVTCSQISNNIVGWGAPSGTSEEQLSPEQKSDIIGNPNSCLIYGNRAQNGKLVVYSTAINNSNFIMSYKWINNNNYSHIAGNTHLEHFATSDFDLFNESNVLKIKLKGSKYVSFRKENGIELFLPTGASNTDMSIVKDAEVGTLIYRTDLKVPIWRTPDWQWREIDGCLPGVPRVGRYQDRPTAEYYKISAGFCYFDVNNNKPIWWTGSKWVDATGAEV
ncbi:MAG: hypothetical protein IKW35_04455 [Paludibacteraceae bacterium]|nr:hypothetical protein [Paludibacteraceae bacterium]